MINYIKFSLKISYKNYYFQDFWFIEFSKLRYLSSIFEWQTDNFYKFIKKPIGYWTKTIFRPSIRSSLEIFTTDNLLGLYTYDLQPSRCFHCDILNLSLNMKVCLYALLSQLLQQLLYYLSFRWGGVEEFVTVQTQDFFYGKFVTRGGGQKSASSTMNRQTDGQSVKRLLSFRRSTKSQDWIHRKEISILE